MEISQLGKKTSQMWLRGFDSHVVVFISRYITEVSWKQVFFLLINMSVDETYGVT